MILSMTGYGKSVVVYKDKKINVEIKSLNGKALDLSTRITPLYREKEMEIRQYIAKMLSRGKVDFAIWTEKDTSQGRYADQRRPRRGLLSSAQGYLRQGRHPRAAGLV